MSASIHLFIPGIPKGQPRPRAFFNKHTGRASVFDAGTAEAWKAQIALALKPIAPSAPFEGAMIVDLLFVMPRPKRLMTKKSPHGSIPFTAKPDLDNLAKAVLDAITQMGCFWRDDAQVVGGSWEKYYAAKESPSGLDISIRPLYGFFEEA